MEPEQTQPKSKKGLYIVVAIIVIIILALLFGKKSLPNGTEVQRSLNGETTYSNDEGSVTMGGASMPENWPSDAPKYPNTTIQYSGTSNPQSGQPGSALAFTTSDKASDVVNFYKKELVAEGWTIEQTATVGTATTLAAKKDTRTFGVYIADVGNGQISVTVGISI